MAEISCEAELAIAIVESLGQSPLSVLEIIGQGEVNHVFVVDDWVVRFGRDPLDTDDYSKEAWCLTQSKTYGIPVPDLIATGTLEGVSYIVQSYVAGDNADEFRSPDLWRTLGRYARKVNEIPCDETAPDSLFPRFGRDLAANWHAHLDYNLAQLTADDPLLSLSVYFPSQADSLRQTFDRLRNRVQIFGLTHGDLVPKNVLLPANGPPVLIDWGSASTGPIPYYDYKRIWLDKANERFSKDDIVAFAEGYGIPIKSLLATITDLHLLDVVDVVRWAIDQRPDLISRYAQQASKVIAKQLG